MILNKTHSNPSDETQYTIFMNDIVRRWPSVEKICILFIYLFIYKMYKFSIVKKKPLTVTNYCLTISRFTLKPVCCFLQRRVMLSWENYFQVMWMKLSPFYLFFRHYSILLQTCHRHSKLGIIFYWRVSLQPWRVNKKKRGKHWRRIFYSIPWVFTRNL